MGVTSETPEITAELPSSPVRRRGRPPVIDDGHLLEVAREVFLARGIRATTQEVAERAGVSEGSLFHRFKSKAELFRQSMKLDEESLAQLFTDAIASIEPLPIRPALEQLATRMLEIGRIALPLMMMSWSNPDGCVPTHAHTKHSPYRRLIAGLDSYIRSQMESGVLRQVDPEVVARALLGAIHHYSMVSIFSATDPDGAHHVEEATFVSGLVDLLLTGLLAGPAAHENAPQEGAPRLSPEGPTSGNA